MMDEYDPVQRIMTKALNIGEGAAVTEGMLIYFSLFLDDKKNDELIKGMNLDQFLTKYTSEDNSTFMKLQAEDQRKLREKIAWVYDQAERANKLNQLAIESGGKGEVHIIEYDRVKPINAEVKPLAIEFSHGEGKVTQNQVAISKNTKLRTQIEDNKVKAPAMQVWNSEAKPNLFFTPDEHFLPTLSLEDIEDRQGPDKEIKKWNTRLPTEFYVNFLKEKNQKNVVKEINMDESVLKYGSNSKLKSNVINGYKLIKKEGDDIDVIANKNKPFDPQIALLKLK